MKTTAMLVIDLSITDTSVRYHIPQKILKVISPQKSIRVIAEKASKKSILIRKRMLLKALLELPEMPVEYKTLLENKISHTGEKKKVSVLHQHCDYVIDALG